LFWKIGNNLLFRGNEPKRNGQFVYNELKSVLQNVAKNESGVVLKDFFLIGEMSFFTKRE
jgi:hypothetical protein